MSPAVEKTEIDIAEQRGFVYFTYITSETMLKELA